MSMSITNIFKISGMPQSEEEQNEIINTSFDVTNIHVHNTETNEYYLVRTTTCDTSRFESIAKLDPNNPDERVIMDEIVSMLSNGDFDLEDQTDNNVNSDL